MQDFADQLTMMQLMLEIQKAQRQQQAAQGMQSQPASSGSGGSGQSGFQMPPGSTSFIKDMFGKLGGGSGAESSGTSSMPWGYILAAIQAQHMASSDTDRRVTDGGKLSKNSGHRTGDIFSGDFFTEPWMAWGEQQLGIDTPTAGEKTDAAIDRMQDGKGGFSDFMSTVPNTAYQWFDPVGNFVDDILSSKLGKGGKLASAALLPQTGLKRLADFFGGLF